jgi:RimJ/RimL family protein N-acetyltransferase
MTGTSLLEGELVRLTAENPEDLADLYSRWAADSELWRFESTDWAYTRSPRATKKWLEKMLLEPDGNNFFFSLRTLDGDRLIGDVGLDGVRWVHKDTFVGIAITDREYWGKGYGTDAMRVILRYAFTELNLHRVTLNTFGYNPRAIRSYEKAGFRHEGSLRGVLNREGKRWDLVYMGILKEEWEGTR